MFACLVLTAFCFLISKDQLQTEGNFFPARRHFDVLELDVAEYAKVCHGRFNRFRRIEGGRRAAQPNRVGVEGPFVEIKRELLGQRGAELTQEFKRRR